MKGHLSDKTTYGHVSAACRRRGYGSNFSPDICPTSDSLCGGIKWLGRDFVLHAIDERCDRAQHA
jgi:hypothetical protein